jgi:hypothetical protein
MEEYYSGGFDLRIPVEALPDDPLLAGHWLVPTNRNRISTDATAWPMPEEVFKYCVETPWSYPMGCINNFSDLLSELHKRGVVTANFTPVCFTISEVTVEALCKDGWAYHFSEAPRMEDLLTWGWQFVGFDVAELNGLSSGLKGFDYIEPSWSQLRARFGCELNEVGLFRDAAIASQFAKLRGSEFRSHAPFDVVGILVHNPR